MAMEASEIARLIKEALPDADVKIEDLRGRMGDQLHALALQTSAPK